MELKELDDLLKVIHAPHGLTPKVSREQVSRIAQLFKIISLQDHGVDLLGRFLDVLKRDSASKKYERFLGCSKTRQR